jgi:hypothetical protein
VLVVASTEQHHIDARLVAHKAAGSVDDAAGAAPWTRKPSGSGLSASACGTSPAAATRASSAAAARAARRCSAPRTSAVSRPGIAGSAERHSATRSGA